MKKNAKQNKYVKTETKKNKKTKKKQNKKKNKTKQNKKIKVSRQRHHAYTNPCPENPKNAETEQNFRTTILTP